MDPEKSEISVSPTKGSGENESSVAMEADKFEAATSNPTPEVLARLERHRLLPKPKGTIKTIEDLDTGDVTDCVDFWQQPGFDNPENLEYYKKHFITYPPQNLPPNPFKEDYEQTKNLGGDLECNMTPSWYKYGECPEGTIPILRLPKLGKLLRKGPPPG